MNTNFQPQTRLALCHSRARSGFTLVEALAALMFMVIVLPVTIHGLQVASRAGMVAHKRMDAIQLAEDKLDELLVDKTWLTGDQDSDFGSDWPGYHWTMTSDDWDEDDMQVVTVKVSYLVQGHEYSISLSTLADQTAAEATDTGL